jgi:hypothetical protein
VLAVDNEDRVYASINPTGNQNAISVFRGSDVRN